MQSQITLLLVIIEVNEWGMAKEAAFLIIRQVCRMLCMTVVFSTQIKSEPLRWDLGIITIFLISQVIPKYSQV